MHDEAQQTQLFSLPPESGDGSEKSGSEPSKITADSRESATTDMPEPISCTLSCSYMGVTTVKRFSLPYAWSGRPEAALIFAAYADSAQEDLERVGKSL